METPTNPVQTSNQGQTGNHGHATETGESPPEDTRIPRHCLRCHNRWLSRKQELPVQCPDCKSTYWNTAVLVSTPRKCWRCGVEWRSRGDREAVPKRCPYCKSHLWARIPDRQDSDGLDCSRCGHIWTQRGEKPPQQCPLCHSHYWRQISRPANPGTYDHRIYCTIPVWARRRGYAPAAAALVMEDRQERRPRLGANGQPEAKYIANNMPALMKVDCEPTTEEHLAMIAFVSEHRLQSRLGMMGWRQQRKRDIAEANAKTGRTPEVIQAEIDAEAVRMRAVDAAEIARQMSPAPPSTGTPDTPAEAMARLYREAATVPPPFDPDAPRRALGPRPALPATPPTPHPPQTPTATNATQPTPPAIATALDALATVAGLPPIPAAPIKNHDYTRTDEFD